MCTEHITEESFISSALAIGIFVKKAHDDTRKEQL